MARRPKFVSLRYHRARPGTAAARHEKLRAEAMRRRERAIRETTSALATRIQAHIAKLRAVTRQEAK